jgi:hypothetical protein
MNYLFVDFDFTVEPNSWGGQAVIEIHIRNDYNTLSKQFSNSISSPVKLSIIMFSVPSVESAQCAVSNISANIENDQYHVCKSTENDGNYSWTTYYFFISTVNLTASPLTFTNYKANRFVEYARTQLSAIPVDSFVSELRIGFKAYTGHGKFTWNNVAVRI